MRHRTVGLLTFVLLIQGSFAPIAAAELPTEVPFKLYGGFAIVVRGDIGNQENLNFLVDRGAVPSVVHRRLARKMNLRGASEEISIVNQNRSVERVVLPLMHIGPLEIPSASVMAVDLSSIEQRLGVRLDAIIGLDVLGRQNFEIDYRRRKLRMGMDALAGDPVPFELLWEAGAPYVVVRMEMNSQTVRLLLDTGTDGLTLFAAHVQQRAPFLRESSTAKDVSVNGEYVVQRTRIAKTRLGGIERSNILVAMIPSAASPQRGLDGMFGPASMGLTRIAFDFTHRLLYFDVN